MIHMMY